MDDFEFYNPVRVFSGRDQLPKIAGQIPSGNKVMLLYGGGSIFKNGVYEKIKEALGRFDVIEFGGIEPNPTYETAMKAVEVVKEKKIDFLLAVGGGSVIDSAKFIAVAVPYRFGDPWNILAKNMPVISALPIGVVFTLPATGTEMNKNAVISRKSINEKRSFTSPFVSQGFQYYFPKQPEHCQRGRLQTE
jgi:NADP-dependent alcohol dehydrogenase